MVLEIIRSTSAIKRPKPDLVKSKSFDLFLLQVVILVTMVTSVRRNASAVFLIWIKNVTPRTDCVIVNLDTPIHTAIKVGHVPYHRLAAIHM